MRPIKLTRKEENFVRNDFKKLNDHCIGTFVLTSAEFSETDEILDPEDLLYIESRKAPNGSFSDSDTEAYFHSLKINADYFLIENDVITYFRKKTTETSERDSDGNNVRFSQ